MLQRVVSYCIQQFELEAARYVFWDERFRGQQLPNQIWEQSSAKWKQNNTTYMHRSWSHNNNMCDMWTGNEQTRALRAKCAYELRNEYENLKGKNVNWKKTKISRTSEKLRVRTGRPNTNKSQIASTFCNLINSLTVCDSSLSDFARLCDFASVDDNMDRSESSSSAAGDPAA